MRYTALSLSIALGLLSLTPSLGWAGFTLTLTETAGNIVVTGSGTINLGALTLVSSNGGSAQIDPAKGRLYNGPYVSVPYKYYTASGLTGPVSMGDGFSPLFCDGGSGDLVGVDGTNRWISVPYNYVSGSLLTNQAIYDGRTLAGIGFAPGTYTYTWGTGANADFLTITSVAPEPFTWAMLGLGAVGMGVVALRRRRATA